MHNLSESYKALSLIKPQSITATNTGTGVDIAQYHDDAIAIVNYGALGGTSETFIAKVETSVIGDFTDAVVALTFSTVTGSTGDNTLAAGRVALHGVTKVRGVITMSGSSASLVEMSLLVRARAGASDVNSTTLA